jgi:hypothetical protein
MGGFGACPKHHYNGLLGYFYFIELICLFITYPATGSEEIRRKKGTCVVITIHD